MVAFAAKPIAPQQGEKQTPLNQKANADYGVLTGERRAY
jgi:hypothetical protein